MTFRVLLLKVICYSFCFAVQAQIISDDFSDGDFTTNPAWTGEVSEFIVNEVNQLQLDFQPEDLKPAYISTNFTAVTLDDKEWRFDLKLDFAPSNSNKVVIYLASSTADLLDNEISGSTQEGYYLEIGENGSDDAVSLYYRNGSTTDLIARGQNGQFADSFELSIRVRRDADGNWEIAVGNPGLENYVVTATGNDVNYNSAENMGFVCYFSTTRRDLFFFDNVYFGDYIIDTAPPEILTTHITGENSIAVTFSEAIDESTGAGLENYHLTPGSVNPSNVTINQDTAFLTFATHFENGTDYTLFVENIADLSGNLMEPASVDFFYFELEEADERDIIISEFFPDPTPVFGLPEAEFVELYNRSEKFISLENWTITDNTSSESSLPPYVLYPGEFVILAPSSAKTDYEVFGPTISPSSWQALNNSEDSISIKSADGELVDALAYNLSWYQDEEKQEGGYSLELINLELDCFDSRNWKASENNTGGTPGTVNSINDPSFTGSVPQIINHTTPERDKIEIAFDKPIDLNSLENAIYTIEPQIAVAEINTNSDEDNSVELILAEDLSNGISYTVTINSVTDCNGNSSNDLSFTFVFDDIPPGVSGLIFLSDSIILVQFDESLAAETAEEASNYSISPETTISDVRLFSGNEVVLILNEPLDRQTDYTLTISGIKDFFDNTVLSQETEFSFEAPAQPAFNQLLITEIMAKPLADQNLPNSQYLEIYNPTDELISLVGLRYMDARDTVDIGLNYILPKEYLIVCPNSNVAQMRDYGRAIGIRPWPNLNNTGDDLQIINAGNELVHKVFYRDTWYKEDFKNEEGGWSLEMIDTLNPCEGFSNWRASVAELKGSPGAVNSVTEDNQDLLGPQVIKAFAPSENEVIVYFDESINITHVIVNQFAIEPAIEIASTTVVKDNEVRLNLAEKLSVKILYTLKANALTDCVGNTVRSDHNSATFAVVEEPVQNDVILDEVLYDPRSGGVDFIELYNRSDKYINLRNWQVLGPSQERTIFPDDNVVMAPGDILALTSDFDILVNQYPNSTTPENIAVTNLPSFPNGQGIVHIISANGELEEYFEYDDDMHVPFLRSVDGVSLERISPDAAIDVTNSWASAAATSGYASPGTVNSQLTNENISFGKVEANPKTFAHNAPGRNYTIINYTIEDAGNIATVKIFDAKGTLVKTLANNETLNNTGFFRWDGDDGQGRKVRTGYYMIYFQLFSGNGNTQLIKEKVAVGANF
ncbi:lamin tail domain-containing protein [Marivirga sp. S37H4]|uniref:Lamin tail domain-containing protein n=1 Tax=Marivirga aurantiaca TaxID=2802615 RepID=A0A934WYI4_9BACT|nr:lamin tail domain-containing protein [Marivirga aurantiaca]MBK6265523.1 lamin tail domain-containing protein [Marivirga aurantiaca]